MNESTRAIRSVTNQDAVNAVSFNLFKDSVTILKQITMTQSYLCVTEY